MTTTTSPSPRYEDVVDLRHYPINEPDSQACRDLVQACRDQLREQGVAQLAGFLTPAAVSQMLAEAGRLAGQAWASGQSHTVYFEPPDDSAGAPSAPGFVRPRHVRSGAERVSTGWKDRLMIGEWHRASGEDCAHLVVRVRHSSRVGGDAQVETRCAQRVWVELEVDESALHCPECEQPLAAS